MARTRTSGISDRPRLARLRPDVDEALRTQIAEGTELLDTYVPTESELKRLDGQIDIWIDYTTELLRALFTTDEIANEFRDACWRTSSTDSRWTQDTQWAKDQIQRGIVNLTSVQRRIALFEPTASAERDATASVSPPAETGVPNSVFVVHGRDDGAKESVARFLERFDLDVTILHEQPNRGRTLIEKFEHHANVGFAVVLLTPDDLGHLKDAPDQAHPRARQNVVLELGYFFGRLGRSRVAALHQGDVELPSDLDGLVYIPLDPAGAWKLKLAAEIKAAGLDVDLNRAS